VTSTTSVVEELESYAAATRRAMDAVLPAAGSRDDGRLSELVRDYPSRGGKGIRPALVMASCRAFGGSRREALGPAVAIELMHNAFLIHDDIEDESTLRRGRPTLHRLHGAALAVNAGDALAVLALAPLLGENELGARLSARVTAEVLRMARLTTTSTSSC
jgi:geranylgeranyl diphosphate synthase type II